ncbi:response regulator transcription factor [Teredinibacter sp. KSP-S5-2]|uniref:helix-turn-helix domain-containing protein n=1 Tax=Teredinibacter sp. KSP-S5-2 TaxID=3034506 RepID=UPI0029352E07|nr:response regulator transcription factor [Teredinibacter sp. KSP-S5-2]WNO10222.1 response regulator transcription factor [Teredinibacter sp. KSP-S5-2]
MGHLHFLWYGMALLSGFVLLGALLNNPAIKSSKGFYAFLRIYLLISGFLLFATITLYVSVNVQSNHRFILLFTVSIPLFLTGTAVLILQHFAESNDHVLTKSLRIWRYGLICAGATLSLMLLTVAQSIILPIVFISALLLAITIIWCQKAIPVKDGNKEHPASVIMIIQSLLLPFLEVLFLQDFVLNTGMTFSQPLVYLINNFLIWHYRAPLFRLNKKPNAEPNHELETLTDKEKEIALAVSQGLSNKEIAAQLNIAPSTVKNHLYTIFRKLNITNRVALVSRITGNSGDQS